MILTSSNNGEDKYAKLNKYDINIQHLRFVLDHSNKIDLSR